MACQAGQRQWLCTTSSSGTRLLQAETCRRAASPPRARRGAGHHNTGSDRGGGGGARAWFPLLPYVPRGRFLVSRDVYYPVRLTDCPSLEDQSEFPVIDLIMLDAEWGVGELRIWLRLGVDWAHHACFAQ